MFFRENDKKYSFEVDKVRFFYFTLNYKSFNLIEFFLISNK
jgi:hypothetical protein